MKIVRTRFPFEPRGRNHVLNPNRSPRAAVDLIGHRNDISVSTTQKTR